MTECPLGHILLNSELEDGRNDDRALLTIHPLKMAFPFLELSIPTFFLCKNTILHGRLSVTCNKTFDATFCVSLLYSHFTNWFPHYKNTSQIIHDECLRPRACGNAGSSCCCQSVLNLKVMIPTQASLNGKEKLNVHFHPLIISVLWLFQTSQTQICTLRSAAGCPSSITLVTLRPKQW